MDIVASRGVNFEHAQVTPQSPVSCHPGREHPLADRDTTR